MSLMLRQHTTYYLLGIKLSVGDLSKIRTKEGGPVEMHTELLANSMYN